MGEKRAWHRARYRVRQFFSVAGAAFTPVDEPYVIAKLAGQADPGTLLRLFRALTRAEQHHGIEVCRALERAGQVDPDLYVAALLHDVGKTVSPPRLWERVLVVLVEALSPRCARAWGCVAADGAAAVPSGWRRGFIVRRNHARWGARMVAEAGASPRVVALIHHHHDALPVDVTEGPLEPDLLAALQAADEA